MNVKILLNRLPKRTELHLDLLILSEMFDCLPSVIARKCQTCFSNEVMPLTCSPIHYSLIITRVIIPLFAVKCLVEYDALLSGSYIPTLGFPGIRCVFHLSWGQVYSLFVWNVRKTSKGKAVPLQAWSGPEGSRMLRFLEWPRGFQEVKVPRFHDNGRGWC